MSNTTTIPAFLDALRLQLMARPGLLDINVFTAEMPSPNSGPKSIQFFSAEADEEWGDLSLCRRNESYTVHGAIRIVIPGGGEEIIQAARNETFRIFNELDAELLANKKSKFGGIIDGAHIQSFSMDAVPTVDGRACAIAFQIAVTAQLPTT